MYVHSNKSIARKLHPQESAVAIKSFLLLFWIKV